MISNEPYPTNWSSKRLKYGASYNDEVLPEHTNAFEEINYVEISGVSINRGIEHFSRLIFHEAPSRARRVVRNGDILVSTVRTYLKAIATVGETKENLIASTGFCVIRPGSEYDSRYLGWIAKSKPFVDEIVSRSTGVSYPAISASELSTIEIPLPPHDTQCSIANFLDKKTAQIDALIEKKRVLLDRLAEKRQALITRLITKGLDSASLMRDSGLDWIGQVPAHWKIKRFRFTARLISGATPTTTVSEYWDGDIPWISPKDMKCDEIFSSQKKVTQHAIDDYGLRLHRIDHAVIVTRGMILARKVPVSVARGAYTINQDMKAIASKGHVLPEFFQMYLSSIESFLFTLVAEAGHGTKALRTDVLSDVPVVIPPIDEQRLIVDRVNQHKNQIDNASGRLKKSIKYLREYRSAIITAAVTGQIESLS